MAQQLLAVSMAFTHAKVSSPPPSGYVMLPDMKPSYFAGLQLSPSLSVFSSQDCIACQFSVLSKPFVCGQFITVLTASVSLTAPNSFEKMYLKQQTTKELACHCARRPNRAPGSSVRCKRALREAGRGSEGASEPPAGLTRAPAEGQGRHRGAQELAERQGAKLETGADRLPLQT